MPAVEPTARGQRQKERWAKAARRSPAFDRPRPPLRRDFTKQSMAPFLTPNPLPATASPPEGRLAMLSSEPAPSSPRPWASAPARPFADDFTLTSSSLLYLAKRTFLLCRARLQVFSHKFCLGTIGTQCFLVNRERPPQQRIRSRSLARVLHEHPQIGDVGGRLRLLGAV